MLRAGAVGIQLLRAGRCPACCIGVLRAGCGGTGLVLLCQGKGRGRICRMILAPPVSRSHLVVVTVLGIIQILAWGSTCYLLAVLYWQAVPVRSGRYCRQDQALCK